HHGRLSDRLPADRAVPATAHAPAGCGVRAKRGVANERRLSTLQDQTRRRSRTTPSAKRRSTSSATKPASANTSRADSLKAGGGRRTEQGVRLIFTGIPVAA